MEAYHGDWKVDLARTQNFDVYLKNAGFPDEFAKEFSGRQWQMNYSSKDGKMVHHVKVTNRPALPEKTYTFTLDQEQEIEGLVGDKSLATVSWDGSKFTEKHRSLPDAAMPFDVTMTRELKGAEMIISSTMKGVTLTEFYVRC